jgi:hypothetical protein
MSLIRRVLLPAVIASVPAQLAMVLMIGARPLTDLLNDRIVDWALSTAVWGAFIAIGYIAVALPISIALDKFRMGSIAKTILLLLAALCGGAALAIVLLLPGLLSGGDLIAALHLSLLGSAIGLVAAVVWLPMNSDLLRRSA